MKTAILVHGDTDGVCSAAIALKSFPGSEVWFTHPVGLLPDLRRIDAHRIIICDLAISERDKADVFEEFGKKTAKGELIYIDHHPLPLDTLASDIPATHIARDLTKSTAELTYGYLDLGNEEAKLLALFGAIADYIDETDFVRKTLDHYDIRTVYLETGILSQAIAYQGRRDYTFKRELVKKLASGLIPSHSPELVKKAVKATKREWETIELVKKSCKVIDGIGIVSNVPRGFSPTKAAKMALGITGLKMCISTRIKKNNLDISARKLSTFPLDLNLTFRALAPRFGGSGGGHPTAAGARIPRKNFEEFVHALKREAEAIP